MRNKSQGFTLIELMITLAIVGILSAVALPSYLNSVKKGRRVDVQRILVSYSQSLERYYSNFGKYTSAGTTCGVNLTAESKYYDIAVFTTTAATTAGCADGTYFIRATPKSGSSQTGDGNQTIDNTGTKGGTWLQ